MKYIFISHDNAVFCLLFQVCCCETATPSVGPDHKQRLQLRIIVIIILVNVRASSRHLIVFVHTARAAHSCSHCCCSLAVFPVWIVRACTVVGVACDLCPFLL